MLDSPPDTRVASLHILHTVGGWTFSVCVYASVCRHNKCVSETEKERGRDI